jgi:hypothetical protein
LGNRRIPPPSLTWQGMGPCSSLIVKPIEGCSVGLAVPHLLAYRFVPDTRPAVREGKEKQEKRGKDYFSSAEACGDALIVAER